MDRLTETWGPDCFVLKGNQTIYSRNPKKRSRVAYALAKLFRLEAAGLEGWTPVEERLPEEGQEVLATVRTRSGCLDIIYDVMADGKWLSGEDRVTVLAWMPWPEPYKPKK